MTTLIMYCNVGSLAVALENTPQFVEDWFSYHLNRIWGINVDIRSILCNSTYRQQIHTTLADRQTELFWCLRMPVLTDPTGYECKVKYNPAQQQLLVHFS